MAAARYRVLASAKATAKTWRTTSTPSAIRPAVDELVKAMVCRPAAISAIIKTLDATGVTIIVCDFHNANVL